MSSAKKPSERAEGSTGEPEDQRTPSAGTTSPRGSAPKKTGAAPGIGGGKTPAKQAAPKGTATKKAPPKKPAAKKLPAKKAAPEPRPAAAKTERPAEEAPAKPAASPRTESPAGRRNGEDIRRDIGNAYTDFNKFAEYVSEINAKSRDIFENAVERRADSGRRGNMQSADPLNVAEAGSEVAAALTANPIRMMQMQLGLWENYTKLMASSLEKISGGTSDPVAQPRPGDKRFSHKAWEENPALDFIKQSYLLFGEWLDDVINNADNVDDETKRRAHFHVDQFVAAMSPTNIPALNPDVIDETLKTQGANWLVGVRNFMEDLERGHGELSIKQVDLDYFEVGRNIAVTPGKVVFQNEMMQLIQYAPTTETVAERPIVIFPPWINKFYILDLQPQNSFIKWLVDQGRTVFVVSWVNPGPELKDRSFTDYMHGGIFGALDAIETAVGTSEVDTIGYCIGGTLLSVTLAYMAEKGDQRIKSATFFTAQTDFEEAGDLLLFVDDKQLDNLERQMDAAGGVLEGEAMARTFNMLRPNDLIWSAFVDNYYLGRDAKRFDLLYWNADATRMTKACHLYYLKNFYRDNLLSRGKLTVEDVDIDLSRVDIPIFMQAGEKDHIAPSGSVYRSAKLFGDDVRYMLAGSGHIAGVINPPEKKKYHYSINEALPDTLEKWKENAERREHSWWPYWLEWLEAQSEGTVPARDPAKGGLEPIEDAPGSYVMVRSDG